jgi:2-polyprenyl-3-methyl-5-hydroxy-6-metoxy-1,4-benzoquinol methylase
MNEANNYIDINRALWNEKTRHHLASDFYDVKGFLEGNTSLKFIELELLGDVKGKSILHLQCHFGQDTLSLARMGAKVTGMDFSEDAIQAARDLATQAGIEAEFICCNVYDLPQHLNKQYDIVYTSYGVLGWLPDMQAWAKVAAQFVKPGGTLLLVEFHPVVWMYSNDFTTVQYSYFNKEAIVETLSGTYADKNAPMTATEVGWNHDLGEVLQSLLNAGLTIRQFSEYEHSPYNVFKNMTEAEPAKYYVGGFEGKLPLVYAVKAIKP